MGMTRGEIGQAVSNITERANLAIGDEVQGENAVVDNEIAEILAGWDNKESDRLKSILEAIESGQTETLPLKTQRYISVSEHRQLMIDSLHEKIDYFTKGTPLKTFSFSGSPVPGAAAEATMGRKMNPHNRADNEILTKVQHNYEKQQ